MKLYLYLPSILVILAGCAADQDQAPAPPRVEVIAPSDDARLVKDFCEVHPPAESAPSLALPALDGTQLPDDPGWTWISFWATWCVPCLAEMPLMKHWSERLGQEGTPVTIRFVSVDATSADLDRFKRTHPDVPETVRIARQELLAPWLPTIGLDASASIPLHLFIDPQNRVRCVRSGAISESDYATVRAVLKGG
jgi:thiol-disulfide isomerase/thioredoxin